MDKGIAAIYAKLFILTLHFSIIMLGWIFTAAQIQLKEVSVVETEKLVLLTSSKIKYKTISAICFFSVTVW